MITRVECIKLTYTIEQELMGIFEQENTICGLNSVRLHAKEFIYYIRGIRDCITSTTGEIFHLEAEFKRVQDWITHFKQPIPTEN